MTLTERYGKIPLNTIGKLIKLIAMRKSSPIQIRNKDKTQKNVAIFFKQYSPRLMAYKQSFPESDVVEELHNREIRQEFFRQQKY